MKRSALILFTVALLIATPGFAYGPGSVMLMGGGNDTRSWADPAWEWFVAAADSGKIINIDADEFAPGYADTFIDFGADASSHGMQITAAQANDQAVYDELITATGIFIEGGDQWEYVSAWNGTLVEDALLHVFNNGGALGGTSAGLAVLSEVIFDAEHGSSYPDDASYNPYHIDVSLRNDFLPTILPGTLADSHFMERGRLGRLVPFLARRWADHGEDLIGLGVDSYSAICIDPDGIGVVYGISVGVLHRSATSTVICEANRPVTFTDLVFHQLTYGARYDLTTRTVLDPGTWLEPLDDVAGSPTGFMDITLIGNQASTGTAGEVQVTGMTGDDLNWWYGDLDVVEGDGNIPQAAVIPELYENNDFYANHFVGGQLAVATHPGFTAIYLDGGGSGSGAAIGSDGVLTVNVFGILLTSDGLTHAGFSDTYSADHVPGFVNARLHFLADQESHDLANYSEVDERSAPRGDLPNQPGGFELGDVYPNPFNGQARVRVQVTVPGPLTVWISDMLGRRTKHWQTAHVRSGWQDVTLSCDGLASGSYLLSLSDGRQTRATRFTVVK